MEYTRACDAVLLLLVRGFHRPCVGFCHFERGIRLILACFLLGACHRFALLNGNLVLAFGARDRHFRGTFGFLLVSFPRNLGDVLIRVGNRVGMLLHCLGCLLSRFLAGFRDVASNFGGRLSFLAANQRNQRGRGDNR
jgi:hypothetical protein